MPQQVKDEIVDTSFQLSIAKIEKDKQKVEYLTQRLSELIKSLMIYDI